MDQQTGGQQGGGRPEEWRPAEPPGGASDLRSTSGTGGATGFGATAPGGSSATGVPSAGVQAGAPPAGPSPVTGGTGLSASGGGADAAGGFAGFGSFGAEPPAAYDRPAAESPAPYDRPAAGQSGAPDRPAAGQSGAPDRPGGLERRDVSERRERVSRYEAVGSFDAFAAGAKRPGGSVPPQTPASPPAGPATDRVALPPAPSDPGSALAVRPAAEPPAVQEGTSLFDSTMPLPKLTRPTRDPLAPELVPPGGGSSRVPRIVTPEYLLTVNPVDGTEVVQCPPEERRTPVRRTPEERAAWISAARPAPPPGPPAPEVPLLERDEERERLIRLLARGRSIRVTGPSGAGRTALLESVANACADLAPDGVIWLSGYHLTAADLLHDLYTVVYSGTGFRPGRGELPGLLGDIGAIVVLDDVEIGGAALEELLDAAPECAFLMSATPDVPAPAPDSMVEEVLLSGLTRVACVDLLQLVTGRRLEEDETAWAADLWFESEGLPLRFVQAGALLRQRDGMRVPPDPDLDDSVWLNGSPPGPAESALPDLSGFDDLLPDVTLPEIPQLSALPLRSAAGDIPLPSLAESAAPADLLASRLSEAAREALAFAVALDGECPHPSHLPALVGDTHGDAALGELISVGLAVPVASHFRLAAGVVQQLGPAFAADGELNDVQAHTAALHYAWWTGHPSVTPERATAESEAILAAMTACRDGGHASAAVLLARTVAPVFAAALHWGAWERALRIGQEAARLSGEVAEEAYFHHELGVLALCTGRTDRARAELEASIALRAALADRQGTVVGRRTLALVNDRVGAAALELPPGVAAFVLPEAAPVAVSRTPPPAPSATRRLALLGSRRNLVAAGTGVLLAAVLGTIVTIGATAGTDGSPGQVKPVESVDSGAPDGTSPSSSGGVSAAPPASGTSPSTSESATDTAGPQTTTTDSGLSSPPDTPSGTSDSSSPTTSGTTGGHTTSGGSTSGSTTGGSTTGGPTTGGTTTGGSTTGGTTTGGPTTGGSTTGGPTTGGTTTGGPTTGGATTGGSTDGGSTDGGSTTGGATTGGATTGGSTDGGATDGGATGG
ncbi:ATP-binding protein [Actinacidiphila sp. ITFR-21]|uniref:ATP-binding protein n=1 Tax=Actinacidiphila sp. ITFR-21 TaxID=3075199 RepID=UPI00288B5B3F|nr:ATP-binding protein [Streptomyces sp. ITFR-21]WNI18128.1 ATP-binding protein [Streptomyces sp. ITFR-21]